MIRQFSTLFLLALLASAASGATVYVAQNPTGDGSGSDTSDRKSLSAINSGWGLSAGDTLSLGGTFTDSLTIGGSGAAGNPITVLFEPGAKMSAPYWTKAIDLNSQSNIVIDGGAGGLITATDNGTLLGNQQATVGISGGLSTGSGIEIKNLCISNLFYRVVLADGDQRNSQPNIQAIFLGISGANNISVHNNTLIQAGNAITFNYGGNCTNISAISNIISDVGFGIFLNCNAAGLSSGFSISHNVCSNLSTYDGNWTAGSGGHNHNDAVIVNSTANSTNSGLIISGNWFGGKNGTNMSSLIKVTPDFYTFSGMRIINNVLVNTDTNAFISNGYISVSDSTNTVIANNTIVNTGGAGAATTGMKIGGDGDFCPTYIYNNIFYGVSGNIVTDVGLTNILASDYNLVRADISDSAFYGQKNTYQTYGEWAANTGFDHFSQTNTPSLSPVTFAPLTNDVVTIRNGKNLTSLGVSNDFNGNARPATGAWTIGAFQTASTLQTVSPPSIISIGPGPATP